MTLVCVCASKGAPGATTTALGLAAAWPVGSQGHRYTSKALIEADRSGGSLAIRYQMPVNPGLLGLAARASSGLTVDSFWSYAQQLPGGLPVVLAPDRPDQIMTSLSSIGDVLAGWLSSRPDLIAVVDIGRLGSDLATRSVLNHADVVLVVARPEADQLQCVSHLMGVASSNQRVGWVLIGKGSYQSAEVVRAYGRPVVSTIAFDAKSVARLYAGNGRSQLRRSRLVRDYGALVERIESSIEPPAVQLERSPQPQSPSPMPPMPPPATASPDPRSSMGSNGPSRR